MKIYNANTVTLDNVEQLVNQAIPILRPPFVEVGLDCTPIRLTGPVVGGKVNVPVVSTISATNTNPTSFENHADTVTGGQATLVHYSEQFGFTAAEQGQGLDVTALLASHLAQIETSIMRAKNALVTTTNFSAAVVTVSSGSYAVANLETLLASVPGRTVVALSPAYYVKTKSTWLPSGDEKKLREIHDLTGMDENVVGYVARPEAVAMIYGYPQVGPSNDIKVSYIKLPCGLDVQFSRWFSRGGRSWSASLDICLGAEVGRADALRIIKSA